MEKRYYIRTNSAKKCPDSKKILGDLKTTGIARFLTDGKGHLKGFKYQHILLHAGDFYDSDNRRMLKCYSETPGLDQLELKTTGFLGCNWVQLK